jgi:hypothetical protein
MPAVQPTPAAFIYPAERDRMADVRHWSKARWTTRLVYLGWAYFDPDSLSGGFSLAGSFGTARGLMEHGRAFVIATGCTVLEARAPFICVPYATSLDRQSASLS